jgi:DNA replication and repair protein RecF
MYLKHLSLTNFRNFARLDMSVPKGTVMLVGANAQGKTSLLEAIYLLATFVSFHAGSDREMVNFLAGREPLAVARIVADFCLEETESGKGGDHRLEIRIIQESNGGLRTSRVRKEVLLDGAKRKLSEAVGAFNAVMFLPQTLRIVEGAPEERRRYLNLTLAQVTPHYAAALSQYSRSLSQRNALLKQIQERGGDKQQLAYWDDQISDFGARLIHARIQAIQELEKIAARVHHDLTRGEEVLRLAYEPAYDPLPKPERQYALPLNAPLDRSGFSLQDIREGLLVALKELRAEEIARGVTTIGPHRDELRFLGNGIDLGTYGSRGQIRTAVLALKLAEVAWMRARSGQWPVLLLDEVLAELDTLRRDDLLARLSQSEQALLTTTDLDLFSADFIERSAVWTVKAGRLE